MEDTMEDTRATEALVESLADAKDCCENCLYSWQYEEQYSFWQCRYSPPVRVITEGIRPDISGVYPAVLPHWWCGRYWPNAEKKAAGEHQEIKALATLLRALCSV